jgi:hypothetical protein
MSFTVTKKARFCVGRKGSKRLDKGDALQPPGELGRIPRVARMLALAIRFDGLIQEGVVKDQADLARLGDVSRARVTQVMNLLCLAPAIQEEILFLPRIERGREPIQEHELRRIAGMPDWRKQLRLWEEHIKFSFSSRRSW